MRSANALALPYDQGSGSCGGSSGASDTEDQEFPLIKAFTGAKSITAVENNAWIVGWDPVDIEDVKYAVYSAKDGAEIDYTKSPTTTAVNFYRYEPENIFTEKSTCFAVRINNKPGDENTAKQCTTDTPFSFEGAQSIERQSDGAYLVKWNRIPVTGVVYTICTYFSSRGVEWAGVTAIFFSGGLVNALLCEAQLRGNLLTLPTNNS